MLDTGKGKHKGKVGSLLCQMANGITFNVGTGYHHLFLSYFHLQFRFSFFHIFMFLYFHFFIFSFLLHYRLSDAERADPPPIGSIITFRYQELTDAGVPRFPAFMRIRTDVKWPPSKK